MELTAPGLFSSSGSIERVVEYGKVIDNGDRSWRPTQTRAHTTGDWKQPLAIRSQISTVITDNDCTFKSNIYPTLWRQ